MKTKKNRVISPTAGMQPLAVIDIGATAIRANIAETDGHGAVRVLESLHQAVNLGRDTFAGGMIEPERTEQCVAILKRFRTVMRRYGIVSGEAMRAVATSVRDAANVDFFLDRIFMATGIRVQVIEEIEVHRLTYMALQQVFAARPALAQGDVLTVEIGGGSSKLLLIRDGLVTFAASVKLGSLRLRELVENDKTPIHQVRALLDQHIRRIIEPLRLSLPAGNVPTLIMGVADFPFAVSQFFATAPESPVIRLTRKTLAAAERVITLSPEALVQRYHLSFEEAETAGPAMLTHVRLAQVFAAREVYAARVSLRQGMLIEAAAGRQGAKRFREQVLHSALVLGRRYGIDERHARHVSDLAVRFFRDFQDEHGLSEQHEILLRTAALLHDIGSFISNRGHHKHSMYLVANSELFGLTAHETRLVAVIVRYHRRALPCAQHVEFMALNRDDRAVVTRLASLLRLADALDRGHSQAIRNLRLTRNDRELTLATGDLEDVALERAGLREKADLFEITYGRQVVLRSAPLLKAPEYHG